VPVEARDDVLYHFAENGESVEEMHGFLRAAREVGGTLFDVGAARGLFASVFCLVSPSNRAVAFEPSPTMLRDAARIAALNGLDGRLELRPTAVGAEPGVVRGSVDVQGLIAFAPGPSSFAVEVTTLDAECARLGVAPDVVKIDVEGHEARVLAGARDLLSSVRPLLFLELHLDLLERHGERPGKVVEVLRGHGYRLETPLGRPLSPAALTGSTHAVVRFVARPA
jgi:FkbM family methyltransferase